MVYNKILIENVNENFPICQRDIDKKYETYK